MEKSEKEKLAEIEEAVKELPEKVQYAVYWTINHFDFVKEMSQNPDMADEEIENTKKMQKKKKIILCLLFCVRHKHLGKKAMKQRSSRTDNLRSGMIG